ncbi:hypothetical protein GGS24DRAFT_490665 [Hypoxylon argillaceum]|nr:hypothetical protein GGS24DRAFT_490665 [Hypoxylon argillaceum]
MIISHAQLAEPRCALSLVVPDWEICAGGTSELEKSSRITRIVTYVRSMGVQVGTLSHTSEHGDDDHILTPTRSFDENVVTVNVSFASEYTRNYYRGHTHVFTLGTTTSLPSRAVEEMLGNNGGPLQPLRGQRVKSILPFDDEPFDEATRRKAAATPIYQHLRHVAVHSPLELMRVNAESLKWAGHVSHEVDPDTLNDALDLDRSAHLWLSWSRMTNLESVFLDLRIYSHDVNTERRCLAKAQVIERAREMGRHLQLQMLMLAGLQSYSFHAVYDGITARDIEEIDEMNGEPNWIKIFRPAVRPGGKIVLVDRLTDHPSHRHRLLHETHDIGRA